MVEGPILKRWSPRTTRRLETARNDKFAILVDYTTSPHGARYIAGKTVSLIDLLDDAITEEIVATIEADKLGPESGRGDGG